MKKFHYLLVLFLFVCTIVTSAFLSCTLSLSDDDDEDESANGTIQLTVSTLFSNNTSSSSRAIVKIDNIKLILIKSDNSESELTDVKDTSSSLTTKYSASVPVGTYSLRVDIFNGTNSSEKPVTSGTSESFTVTAKKTSKVSVSCVPTEDFVTEKEVDTTFTETLKSGYENWYSFTATTEETDILVSKSDKSDTSKITFAVYDSSGVASKKVSSTSNPDKAKNTIKESGKSGSLKVATEENEEYYLIIYNETEGTEPAVEVKISAKEVDSSTTETPAQDTSTDDSATGTIEVSIS